MQNISSMTKDEVFASLPPEMQQRLIAATQRLESTWWNSGCWGTDANSLPGKGAYILENRQEGIKPHWQTAI